MPAAGLHDYPYEHGVRLTIDPEIASLVILDEMEPSDICALPRTWEVVDRDEVDVYALYEPLRATAGNTDLHAKVVYRGVRLGGWHAWNKNARARVRNRVPFSRVVTDFEA
jgi:hypothetical protein